MKRVYPWSPHSDHPKNTRRAANLALVEAPTVTRLGGGAYFPGSRPSAAVFGRQRKIAAIGQRICGAWGGGLMRWKRIWAVPLLIRHVHGLKLTNEAPGFTYQRRPNAWRCFVRPLHAGNPSEQHVEGEVQLAVEGGGRLAYAPNTRFLSQQSPS